MIRAAILLAAAIPSGWSPRGVATDARTVAAGTATVRPGETIGHVARRTGTGVDALAKENRLAPPYRIAPGRRLRLPGGRYHAVRGGQTGIAIARAYGLPWARILAANGLAEPYRLRAGERLLIPPADGAAGRRTATLTLDIDDILTGGEPAAAPDAPPPARRGRTGSLSPPAAAPRFVWPLEGALLARFGVDAGGVRSDGIRIAARSRAPVRAAAAGTVAYAGHDIPALGRLILIRHDGGWITAYAHAAALLVKRGMAVRQGQAIARAGRTGRAAVPQLLFQIRRGRVAIDPLGQLPPRSGKGGSSLVGATGFEPATP